MEQDYQVLFYLMSSYLLQCHLIVSCIVYCTITGWLHGPVTTPLYDDFELLCGDCVVNVITRP